jgi:hypothetical protein
MRRQSLAIAEVLEVAKLLEHRTGPMALRARARMVVDYADLLGLRAIPGGRFVIELCRDIAEGRPS